MARCKQAVQIAGGKSRGVGNGRKNDTEEELFSLHLFLSRREHRVHLDVLHLESVDIKAYHQSMISEVIKNNVMHHIIDAST